jgi:hypothetical protein
MDVPFLVGSLTMAIRTSDITLGDFSQKAQKTRLRGTDTWGMTDGEQLDFRVAMVEVKTPIIGLSTVHAHRFMLTNDPADLDALHTKMFIGGHTFSI